jgi:hypothetical protein
MSSIATFISIVRKAPAFQDAAIAPEKTEGEKAEAMWNTSRNSLMHC